KQTIHKGLVPLGISCGWQDQYASTWHPYITPFKPYLFIERSRNPIARFANLQHRISECSSLLTKNTLAIDCCGRKSGVVIFKTDLWNTCRIYEQNATLCNPDMRIDIINFNCSQSNHPG